MAALDKNRITVLSADKTSGIIQTDYFGDNEREIAGGFLGVANTRIKCNLTLRNQPDGFVKLNITAKCEATTRGDGLFSDKAPEQWHDVTSRNVQKMKDVENRFYEGIEKELNTSVAGNHTLNEQRERPQFQSGNSEVLTNDSIVKLVKAGMSEEIIVNMVKAQPTRFDVSVDGLLTLKSNSVSDKIINEMVLRGQGAIMASATTPHGPVKLNDGPEAVVTMKPPIATTNTISDPAVAKLCESLTQDNPGKVKDALKKLRDKKLTINASEVIPKILQCLTHSNPDVVREACRTLVVVGNQDAVPAIIPLLTHERPDIIREACRTLAILGNKDVILSIQPLLTNPRSDVREEAFKAITTLQAKS
jgi:hypothetical protein